MLKCFGGILLKKIIGSIERITLPELGLYDLDAKIDTGAENCALHGDIVSINDGFVSFILHDEIHPAYNGKIITLPIAREADIKSSNGETDSRIFIKTKILVFGKEYNVSISLADRSKMKYPMLLGKRFLKGRFLVDVEQEYNNKGIGHKC